MKRKRDFSAPTMRAAADKMLRAASEGDLDGMAQGYQTSEWLLEAEDEMGLCPLHLAVKHRNEMATTFLLGLGSDVSAVDERGWTALHMALDGGSPKVTHALLSHMQGMSECGALRAECLNARTYQDGRTALHIAVERRAEGGRWVEALVGLGADLNVADRRARSTPLHLAVQQGYLQVRFHHHVP
jgi:ankyrin repeat protein